jgi:hypothetical protein
MTNVEALLDAGALLPVKTKVDKKSAVDLISARKYRHTGLGDRPIVRLTADGLARGDDLMMEFMGFTAPDVEGPIAQKRRQALGFPGWALINDPDHARYALELLKQFRKEAKRAKSKPGHAYDAFIDIGKTLGRSVAHFLPSYWEEVGRVFIGVGNNHYGSRAFGKAREAEKVHALKIDENLRQEAFLEFALAGCLTNKALNEHGKDLQSSHKPAEAWQLFRELCVRRTLGGMPPWVSMIKDISPLIISAGLDVDAELHLLFEEILDSPAMVRAPMGFWKASANYFQDMCGNSERIAGLLLNLLPQTNRWDRSGVWQWLDYLKEWGILENAWKDGVAAEAAPRDGAAAWLGRFAEVDDNPPQKMHDLLRSMAKRLKKEKLPLNLTVENYRKEINVDLLDLALELKVPLTPPTSEVSMNLNGWAEPPEDAVDRPRDPQFIAKSKKYQPLLMEAVGKAVGNLEFEAAATGKPSLLEARREWLLNLVDSINKEGVIKGTEVLSDLDNQTTRATFQEFPEAYAALNKIDLVPVLARTIQGGLFDEYGWPVLEKVVAKMNPKGKTELKFFGAAPHVIVSDGAKAVVVDHTGIVFEHELKLKKGLTLKDLQFLDGELLVVQGKRWSETQRYWSSAPKKAVKEWYNNDFINGFHHHRDEGGTFTGDGSSRAGDKELSRRKFFSDGEHYWISTWDEKSETRVIKDVDADTGKEGRKSMPSFLENFIKSGKRIDEQNSELLPFGDAAMNSPLGSKDGLVGWRIRFDAIAKGKETRYDYESSDQKNIECEGIDGRKWKGHVDKGLPIGLLDLPGSTEKLVVVGTSGWSWSEDSTCTLWDSKGEFAVGIVGDNQRRYYDGQAVALPPLYWHMYQARDEKTSKKLRSLSLKQAKLLLEAAVADREALDEDVDSEDSLPKLPKTAAAIKKWLPTLKDDRLSSGIQGLIFQASGMVDSLEELLDGRDPNSDDAVADAQQEACVEDAMESLGVDTGYGEKPPLFPHLANAKAFFIGEREAGSIPPGPFNWAPLLDDLDTQVYGAYWNKQALDEKLAEFLLLWADIGLFDLPGSFRYYEAEFTGKAPFSVKKKRKRSDDPPWILHEYKGNKFICWQESHWDDDFQFIEYAPKDKFQVLPSLNIEYDATECSEGQWNADQIRAYVKAFQERELPWPDKETLKANAAQIKVSVGELGLFWFGLPNIDSWETNFLPKPVREHLGLKVKEASNAKQSVTALKPELKSQLLSSLLNGPPEDLWDNGGQRAMQRLMETWGGGAPKRLDISADLMKALDDAGGYGNTTEYTGALADPKKSPYLTSNAKWQMGGGDDENRLAVWCSEEETFDSSMLNIATLAIPLLYSKLPGGSSATKTMGDVFTLANRCVNKPGLLFQLVSRYFWSGDTDDKNEATNLVKQLVGKTKVSKGVALADNGQIAASADDHCAQFAFRPAKVKTAKDHERLMNLLRATRDPDEGTEEPTILFSVQLMRSDGYKAIIERIKKGQMADGAFDSNPLASAPATVAQIAKKKKLSEEAATYYLQLLTLHDPTAANIKLWNDWTTAAIAKAGKELVSKKLVLEAKRPRAGRTHFLPGGWEPLKIPNLPLETWKLPLYGITRDAQTDRLQIPLARIVPLCPLPDLFKAAWKRVSDGDPPKYEEVK